MMWSTIGYMKPSNCASATGRMPCEARPTVRPAMVVSSSGVSSTRWSPKVACRPAVARNTPPLTPTSSPSTTTVSSCLSSQASACVIASMRVIAAISATLPLEGFGTLGGHVMRHVAVQVIEHRLHRLHAGGEVGVDLLVSALVRFHQPQLFLVLVPDFQVGEVLAQAQEGLAFPAGLHFFLAAIAARVVGGGVVGQSVGDELDAAAAVAVARALEREVHGRAHRDDVVAVDLQRFQAAGDALLRQSLGAGLRLARYRDRPAVVDDALDEGQRERTGGLDRC